MKHLYQKIYLTIIASLLVVVLVSGIYWRITSNAPRFEEAYNFASELIVAALPPKEAPPEKQQEAVSRIASRLKLDLALFDQNQTLIASYGKHIPKPARHIHKGGRMRGGVWVINLPDKRWLSARPLHRHHYSHSLRFIGFLSLIALVVGLCAYPVVRGLTRRLERLQQGVETLGAGNFSARIPVEGKDEVARLATRFNLSAERIESLLKAHRQFLANASHELRTPLSRLRIGIEFLKDKADPKRKKELETDINELDDLISEILLASRLDNLEGLETSEDLDFLALVAEECARYEDCELEGQPAEINGDPRLLRRLVRNLIENAHNYGKPPVTIKLNKTETHITLDIIDTGDGIPEAEDQLIFTPFYQSKNRVSENKGAGLGLSLVKQIAQKHGGDALVAPRHEHKSCFRVTLLI